MTQPDTSGTPIRRRSNRRVGIILGAVAFAMVGAAFAAVPAYRVFCQITGYGGTPRTDIANTATGVLDREITVRFDASLNQGMPWRFEPGQREVTVKLGERALVHYVAENPSGEAITGTATFNVTPLKAAQYFSKVECFCFTEQRLAAGERANMPITFYVDPALADDENLSEVKTITLSYTFFRKDTNS